MSINLANKVYFLDRNHINVGDYEAGGQIYSKSLKPHILKLAILRNKFGSSIHRLDGNLHTQEPQCIVLGSPVLISVVMQPSRTMLPTSMGYVSFRALYYVGWRITGNLPAQNFCNFFKSGCPTSSILMAGKASFAAQRWTQTFKPLPMSLIQVMTPGALGKFLASSTNSTSTGHSKKES